MQRVRLLRLVLCFMCDPFRDARPKWVAVLDRRREWGIPRGVVDGVDGVDGVVALLTSC